MVHVAAGSEYLGHIVISDQVKEDAAQAVQELKALGVRKTAVSYTHLDVYKRQLFMWGNEYGEYERP